MQLTNDQQAASAAFTHFMTTDENEKVLSGGAGVGKTTLLKHLMDLKDPSLICRLAGIEPIEDWVLTATTNKAAEVLGNSTGREASTIHSYLGLAVYNDYETGRTKITKTRRFSVKENTLIVVDEASMVDRQLRQLIHEGTKNCKILYVGDHCQLAPIGEEMSPVFSEVTNRSYLNQIVRSQNAPPITALALQLRATVETGVFRPIAEVPGWIDYLTPDQAKLEIEEHFIHRLDLAEQSRILCFTNNKVVRFNDYIRQGRGLPPEIAAKDVVIACNAAQYKHSTQRMRIEQELRVLQVDPPIRYRLPDPVDFYVRTVHTNYGQIDVPVDRAHWQSLIKHYKKLQNWPAFYELQERLADVRPRDACTVHKSQGSTYRTVFIDLEDIGTCRIPSQVARMLYVACSRPTHRICFIGRLPPKYGG